MTRSHRVLLAFLLAAIGALLTGTIWAQPFGGISSGIPLAVKTAAVMNPGAETQIKTFITEQVGKLADVNPESIPRAREALITEAKGGSPPFLAKYAEILNAEILGLLQRSQDPRVRLNAGIVVANVADIARNTKLEKAVLALLDKNAPEPLKIVGMRAAKSVLPELVKVNAEKPLVEALLAAVKQFPASGSAAQDGYDALNPRNVPPKNVPAIIDPLLDLLAWRVGFYKNGLPDAPKVLVPDEPLADASPFNNIFNQGVWLSLDKGKKQDVRAMQLACELLVLTAQRGDEATSQNLREQLKDSIGQISGALYVAASLLEETNVANAAKDVYNRARTQVPSLKALVGPLCELIPQMKGFESIKPIQLQPATPGANQAPAPAGNGAPPGPNQK